jgi:hypothetical protein
VKRLFATLAIALLSACTHAASPSPPSAPLTIPFDFSRNAIDIQVTVSGRSLRMLLDTGVDPSVIDLAVATSLGLSIDRSTAGEAAGTGDAASAAVYPTMIDSLTIENRSFASVDAVAFDMTALSTQYGRQLDGVLGWSFLNGQITLIDYAEHNVYLLDRAEDAVMFASTCRQRWQTPLRSFEGDTIPIIPSFRFGDATGPVSLDTGSNSGVSLYQSALDLPRVRDALVESGQSVVTGARGASTTSIYTLNVPVGFGPFTLPAGQTVSVRRAQGSPDTRVANAGNQVFAALTPKMLLDYRARAITFYAECEN